MAAEDQKNLQDQMSVMLPTASPGDDPELRKDDFTAASFAADSWEETKQRFMDAGKIDVDPDDPELFTAYKRSIDYLKDTGLAGLSLADTAFKYAVGAVSQAMPTEELEKRMARDLYSMPDAFMGSAGAKSLNQLDDAVDLGVETAKQVSRSMPEYDPTVTRVSAGAIPKARSTDFKKTRPAYKLFVKGQDEKLYPLFVNASDEIPVNEWLEADFPDVAFKGKTQKGGEGWYVPTKGAKRDPDKFFLDGQEITKKEYDKLGANSKPFATIVRGEKPKATGDRIVIPDEETRQKLIDAGFITDKTGRTEKAPYGTVTAVAARPGFHASSNPVAEHLGPQDIKISKSEADKLIESGINPKAIRRRGDQYYVKRRAEDQYWAEVEMADDTSDELRAYMESQGRTDINDKVPKGGSYSYVDGQADGDTWVVGGDMRVKKVLSREEAKAAQEAAGVKDLPYRDEVEAILGRKFSEGGLVGEDMYTGQQDYLLAASSGIEMNEGGVVPDNTVGIDPVSGNEVPIGSTPEEVRDDIPAQLSEGEYVVPADVVRYYGVKFFEDLRSEAKMGWSNMEQNGRIGGEPVGMEMVEPEDDLPFDVSELQVVDDGIPEMNEGGYMRGYAEGGYGQAAFAQPAVPTGTTTTQYYVDPQNPQGAAVGLIFINGLPTPQAQAYLDRGFVPRGSTQPTPTVDKPMTETSQDDGSSDTMSVDKEEIDWNKASSKQVKNHISMMDNRVAQGAAAGIGAVALGPVGGIMGSIAMGNAKRNEAYDMRDIINDKLKSGNLSKQEREDYTEALEGVNNIISTGDDGKDDDGLLGGSGIFGGRTSMYEGLKDTTGGSDDDGNAIGDGRTNFGDTWLGDALGFDGSVGVQGASLSESLGGARRESTGKDGSGNESKPSKDKKEGGGWFDRIFGGNDKDDDKDK